MVRHPHDDTLTTIAQAMAQVPQADRDEVQALVVQELRRLHEGVLARYGLRLRSGGVEDGAADAMN